jgi:excisionase family DNA binding protein
LFRKYEGNFYTAVIYSVQQLVKPANSDQDIEVKPESQKQDNTKSEITDTTLLNLLKK